MLARVGLGWATLAESLNAGQIVRFDFSADALWGLSSKWELRTNLNGLMLGQIPNWQMHNKPISISFFFFFLLGFSIK